MVGKNTRPFYNQVFMDFMVQTKCEISNNMPVILKIINNIFHRNIIRYPVQDIYIDAAAFILF